MSKLITVSPAAGDTSTSLFMGADASSAIIAPVESGTILTVLGQSSGFYQVAYKPAAAPALGGGGNTGVIAAVPYCSIYKTNRCRDSIGNLNNGTVISIIEHDVELSVYKVSGFSTEGPAIGWVESNYLFLDTVQNSRSISTMSVGSTGTVTAKSGLMARSAASVTASAVGGIDSGSTVTILESSNGYYKVNGVAGWGTITGVWVTAAYVEITSNTTVANVPVADTVVVNDTSTTTASASSYSATDNYLVNFGNIEYVAGNGLDNDAYYTALAEKATYALGTPPKYNMDIDIQYTNSLFPGAGRVYQKTFLSNANYLSLCPGKVVMFPDLLSSEKSSIVENLLGITPSGTSIGAKILADSGGEFDSKMYTFKADTATYAEYLNTLCRSTSIMMGIGDNILADTGQKLKLFDYTYWAIRKRYNAQSATSADPNSGIFTNFWSGAFSDGISGVIDSAISDTSYINFFLNATETSISESISTSVEDSPLQSTFDTVSSMGSMINYFTGSGFNLSMDEASSYLTTALGTGEGLESLATFGNNILKGGRMILPKMISGASYGKSVSFNFKYLSVYGDKESIFYKCLIPINHILALALPKQVSDNMYTYPFIIRGGQVGGVNIDLGVISGVSITKGGDDNTSYSVDQIATEWEVQLEITPLIEDLMITSSKNPLLFIKNEGLLDYLANMCGFDMMACNLESKLDFFTSAALNTIYDIPASIENKITDSLTNAISGIFKFGQ